MTKRLTAADLRQFTGTSGYYRHALNRRVVWTDGVMHVAEAGEAHWLIDAIASYLTPRTLEPHITRDPRIGDLHFWKLAVREDNSAVLSARADSGVEPFIQQEIPYTDFPLAEIDIWVGWDQQHWRLYLPSEH